MIIVHFRKCLRRLPRECGRRFWFQGLGHWALTLVFLRLIVKPKVDAVMRMGMQSCEEHAEEDSADNAHERDASIVVIFWAVAFVLVRRNDGGVTHVFLWDGAFQQRQSSSLRSRTWDARSFPVWESVYRLSKLFNVRFRVKLVHYWEGGDRVEGSIGNKCLTQIEFRVMFHHLSFCSLGSLMGSLGFVLRGKFFLFWRT